MSVVLVRKWWKNGKADGGYQKGSNTMSSNDELESRLRELEVQIAKDKVMLDNVLKEQDRLRTGWNRIAWIIGGAVLSAIVTFIVKGGLVN